MQRYERLWERLVTLLGALGEVEQRGPDRLVLTIDEHQVELVMSETDWDDLVSIPHGSFMGAAATMLRVLTQARGEEKPYVVYDMYDLHVADSPTFRVEAELEEEHRRHEALRKSRPDAPVEVRAFSPSEDERT